MSNYTRYPDPAGGIKIYPSVTDFPIDPGRDGVQAVAADTNTLYIYDTSVPGWQPIANPGAVVAITGLQADVSATGPGVVNATVNSVGGAAAADVATSVSDTQAATDLSTASTLMKRDASSKTALKGLKLDGATSGTLTIDPAAITTSYSVTMPAAQGAASTFLQNNGAGVLSWTTVPSPYPAFTDDRVLYSAAAAAEWRILGTGSSTAAYPADTVIVGRLKPAGLTGTSNVIIGPGTTGASLTTAPNTIIIGHNAGPLISSADGNTIVGTAAGSSTTGRQNTLIGQLCNSGTASRFNTVVGFNSGVSANVDNSIVLGLQTGATGSNAIVIGSNATGAANSIAIGGTSTALANTMAVGSSTSQINTVYLGRGGATQTAANAVTIMTMQASGTNTDLSAGTLTLAGSQSTGNKAGGDVIIATAPAGASGSTLNAHVERMRITSAGNVGIGTASPTQRLDVSGTVQATAVQVPNYILSPQLYDEGTKTGNFTLNFANGPCQQVTINAAGPLVITLSNPVTGGAYLIKMVQGATTGTVTWPANVKWGAAGVPTLSNTTGKIDIINLYYDGTDYYGTYALGF